MHSSWAGAWPGYYQNPHVYQPYIPAPVYGGPRAEWDHNPPPPPASSKYPNLNPILASDTTLLRFDIKKKPRNEINSNTYYTNRHLPAIYPPVTKVRLISKSFPWSVEIPSRTAITCEDIWDALYAAFQQPIADSEWGFIIHSKKQREVVERAAKRRAETDGDKKLKRIDYLGDATLFKGLEKDEEFEKHRPLPGSEKCEDTWVVRLG